MFVCFGLPVKGELGATIYGKRGSGTKVSHWFIGSTNTFLSTLCPRDTRLGARNKVINKTQSLLSRGSRGFKIFITQTRSPENTKC